MVASTPPDDAADLVEHGRFVRNLAWRLLHDEDAAEEVVQETMLAAVRAKPSRDRPLRPWLATVARNVIRRRFRGEGRRRRREEAAARPESLPSTADMAARAEMLREVVEAVLSLDEPNRSTVLLRYYEDLPPREIAVRQGVGVETVRGRIKRAVQQLRRRLDARHPRGRKGWVPIVAGLCGFEVPHEILAGAGGAATEVATGATTSAAPASAGLAAALAPLAAAFLVGAVGGGVAVWQGAGPTRDAPRPATVGASLAERGRETGPREEEATLRGSPEAADRLARLEAENEALRGTAERLREELASLTPPPLDPQAFRFALPERAVAFDGAKWTELAGHMLALTKILRELKEEIVHGRDPTPREVSNLVQHNQPLATFAVAFGAEVGDANPNGAYTHPAVIANLIRAALALAEEPLSRDQEIAIRVLGERWEAEVERLVASASPDAPVLAQMVAEVDAKLRFLDAVKDVLTSRQRDALFPPEADGRLKLDLLSPALVYALVFPVEPDEGEAMGSALLRALLAQAAIVLEDLADYEWVGRQWVAEIPDALTPEPRRSVDRVFPPVERVQTWARAQAAATERILGMGLLAAKDADRLRDVSSLLAPFVCCPPGGGD